MSKLLFIFTILLVLALEAIVDGANPDGSIASSKFKPGDRVWTTTDLKVRSDPGLASTQIDSMADGNPMIKGNTGTVLDGPVSKDDYIWWKINYDIGITGWSAEKYLDLVRDGPQKPDDFAQWSDDAIKWATDKDRLGSNNWNRECLRFVSNAFRQKDATGESGYTSATNAARNLYRSNQEQGGWQHAPKGAAIFFDGKGSNPDGHVGIYLGDGKNIINAYGKVQEIAIEDAIAKEDVGKYIGWSYPPEAWRPTSQPSQNTASATDVSVNQVTQVKLQENDEQNFVARVIFAEAGPSCSDNERELIASVMINRINNPAFGNGKLTNMYEVANYVNSISGKHEFSCINDPNNHNWANSAYPSKLSDVEKKVWDQCYSLAEGKIQQHYGLSGHSLVYYHDKSISKPSSWDNKYWSAVKELETDHFIFYSIIEAIILPPPSLVSPGSNFESGESIDTLSPTFQWNVVPNADFYAIYISKYPYGTENLVFNSDKDVQHGSITGSSFKLPNLLQEGMKYRWNMKAHNVSGWSDISKPFYFKTGTTGPKAIKVDSSVDSSVRISSGQTLSSYGFETSDNLVESIKDLVKNSVTNQYNTTTRSNKTDAIGAIDLLSKKAKVDISFTSTITTNLEVPTGSPIIATSKRTEYTIGNSTYIIMNNDNLAQFKDPIPADALWAEGGYNLIKLRAEFINQSKITVIGSESIDGKDCYKLRLLMDDHVCAKIINKMLTSMLFPFVTDVNETDLVKNSKVENEVWIEKDNYLPKEYHMTISIKIAPDFIGVINLNNGEIAKFNQPTKLVEVLINDDSMERYFDYSKPVAIVVPKDVLKAPPRELSQNEEFPHLNYI